MLPGAGSVFPVLLLEILPLCADGGRGVAATFSEVDDEAAGGVLSFWGRCPRGNIGSGVFFLRILLKKGFDAGDFLGVVAGLVCDCRSLELTSDRDDSD